MRLRVIYSVVLLSFLTACGGGGGGGGTPAPVASTDTFQLKTAYINEVTATSSTTFSIRGTSSGVSFTGSGTATEGALSSAIFEGSNCNQKVTVLTGSITGNNQTVPYADTSTEYYDSSYNYLGSSGNEYTVVIGTMNLPITAKVNDTGAVYTENIYPNSSKPYSTGTYTASYALEPDTASTAILKLISTERNTSNTVVATAISVIRITPSGTITRLYETYSSSTDNFTIYY